MVNKIPAMVETLVAKNRAWEEERAITFTYDGLPLLAMLDEYAMLKHEREEEKVRMRDHKKYQDQMGTDTESVFGSRPSPAKRRVKWDPNRRLSLNTTQNGSLSMKDGMKSESRPSAPVNYVAISTGDDTLHVSTSETNPATP